MGGGASKSRYQLQSSPGGFASRHRLLQYADSGIDSPITGDIRLRFPDRETGERHAKEPVPRHLQYCSARVEAILRIVVRHEPVFEIDWYIQMQSNDDENVQIAFVAKDHPSVPPGFALDPQGVVITLEFDDVDLIYERAGGIDLPIVQDLRDEEWGQRHFMVKDPNGLLVDVVKMIGPSDAFAKQYL